MSSIVEKETANAEGRTFSMDLVTDHMCFGCKHAMLLPVKEWTLTRRLRCKNASGRRLRLLKPLVDMLARYCEAEEHQPQNFIDTAIKQLNLIKQRLDEAYVLIVDEHHTGYCNCISGECGGMECKEEDAEAKERLHKGWKDLLAEVQAECTKACAKTRSIKANG